MATTLDPTLQQRNPFAGKALVTLKEATHYLGFKDLRVTKRLIISGNIKATKIGSRTMVNVTSLLKFVGEA